jgi:isopropylmalate/homocitrate/citramalate synthase
MTSIEMKLKRYNIELDEEAKKALLSDVKSLGIQKKGVLTDEEFLALTKRYSK